MFRTQSDMSVMRLALGFGTGGNVCELSAEVWYLIHVAVPKGCGFTLQNRGCGFVLDEKHPNALRVSYAMLLGWLALIVMLIGRQTTVSHHNSCPGNTCR